MFRKSALSAHVFGLRPRISCDTEGLHDAFVGTYPKCHLQPSTEHRRIIAVRYQSEPRLYSRGTSLYSPTNLAEDTSHPIFLTFGLGQSSSLVHFFPVMGFLNVEIRWKTASSGRFLVDLDDLIEQVCLGAQVAGDGNLASNDRVSL